MNKEKLIKEYYKVFGDKINSAICLIDQLGVNEFAWDFTNVFEAIEILKQKKIAIIGGDVLVNNNGEIDYAYVFWSVDKTQDSYKLSIENIKKYEKDKDTYLFVLIFSYNKYMNLGNDDKDVIYIH